MKSLTLLLLIIASPLCVLAANELIVTELMYNSPGTDVEWIELYNDSGTTLDLTGWYVLDDNDSHEPMPLSGTMAPGEVMLLVGDEALFTAQYPGVVNYFPVFFQTTGDTWALGNGGDGVRIHDATDALVFAMDYDDEDGWPEEPDGDGPSLLLHSMACTDFTDLACWIAGEMWGTPGVLVGTTAQERMSWSVLKETFR